MILSLAKEDTMGVQLLIKQTPTKPRTSDNKSPGINKV